MNRLRIFISSVQKELAEERRALKDYIEGDALLGRFFEVFLFEAIPATDRRADDLYLDQVEAIVNAVAHRDYASSASVQVMLFANRLEVWNPGALPPALTLEKLRQPHASFPANPLLAEPLYLTKYIERMGTGTGDMIRRCRDAGLSEPDFRLDGGCFVLTLRRKTPQVTTQVGEQVKMLDQSMLEEVAAALSMPTTQVTTQVATQVAQALSAAAMGPQPRDRMQTAAGLANREHFRKAYLDPLVTAGWLARTIPDKPTSRLQKYRLTDKGRAWLRKARP